MEFFDQYKNQILVFVSVFLTLILLFFITKDVILALSTAKKNNQLEKTNVIVHSDQKSRKSIGSLSGLTSSNLFGKAEKKNAVNKQKNIPKSTLNLILEGVLSAKDPNYARALIRSGRGKTQVVSVDEKIKGVNAKLLEVKSNEVVLSRGGAQEKLTLSRKAQGQSTQKSRNQRPHNQNQGIKDGRVKI